MKPKKEQGQISIMIGIMMSTFILLFAFVVNTGMLVNAKINLQNAADLAAYAGAAVQARQMNQIGYLNYEMRRQWKKLLFRIYVLGNMAQDGFPKNFSAAAQGQSTKMIYQPNNTQDPDVIYNVPTTCIIFNSTDNFCHLISLPGIQIPPQTFIDSITDTLRGQLQAIENIRQKNCEAIGMTNIMLNIYWLYNTDPTLSNLNISGGGAGVALDADQTNVLKIIQTLATGLGIVPREMILKFRIKTLESYINTPAQTLSYEKIMSLQKSADPAVYERSIQAFLSAYYTLGSNTFSSVNTITMDELLPSQMILLNPITQRFDTFAIDMQLPGNGGPSSNTNPCTQRIVPVSVTKAIPVGFTKDKNSLTYYAVRLKATAKVLFSPFGDIEMKAYSAAMPFGSRIGPQIENDNFAAAITNGPPTDRTANSMGLVNLLPNLPIRAGESSVPSQGSGWDTQDAISTFFQAMSSNGGSAPTQIDSAALERAYHAAMAPNPWEVKYYNIPIDGPNGTPGPDAFVRIYDVNHMASIRAPIFSSASGTDSSQEIKGAIDEIFNDSSQLNVGSGANSLATLKAALSEGMQQYVGKLASSQGEDRESTEIARIKDPLYGFTPKEGIMTTNPKEIRTAWPGMNHSTVIEAGRTGYSVKFISFSALQNKSIKTNGSDTGNNVYSPDAEAELDFSYIKH